MAADFEAQKKRNAAILAGVAVAAVVAGLIGAGAYLRLGASTPKPALQVRGDGPPSALQVPAHTEGDLRLPGHTTPAPLRVGATQKQMPADVRAWLEHLQRCEQIKAEILEDQAVKGMVAPDEIEAQKLKQWLPENDSDQDDGKPANNFADDKFVSGFKPVWIALQKRFLSVQPPQECLDIASAYNTGLAQMPDTASDISKVLGGDLSDPAKAIKSVKSALTLNTLAEKSFKQADEGVSRICSKYDTKKWFDVNGLDIGGGGFGKFGGLGGGSELSGLGGAGLGQ